MGQKLGQDELNMDRQQEPEGHHKIVIAITIVSVPQDDPNTCIFDKNTKKLFGGPKVASEGHNNTEKHHF